MAGDAVTVNSLLSAAVSDLPTCGQLRALAGNVCCSFMSLVPKELPSGS